MSQNPGTALENVIEGEGPGSTCPPGSGNAECRADVTIDAETPNGDGTDPEEPKGGSLPFTGLDTASIMVVGLLTLFSGAALLGAWRRRRRQSMT